MRAALQAIKMQEIRTKLLAWHDQHQRDLPWRRTRDPYRILVSEIMLQQTRVAAVIPYYQRFLTRFPTPAALAGARETTVLRAWAGLGYYSRARNLQAAARQIAKHGFPASYKDALALPGIGPYTAAAVMSIAFGQVHAAVDGNVRRVLSRLLASHTAGQSEAQVEAEALLDRRRPGDFNQAMMELGATICLPRTPNCEACPVSRHCKARRLDQVARFPARKIKRETEDVRITWAYVERDVERNRAILLQPPKPDGLWNNFWTLPDILLRDAKLIARVRHTVTFRKIEIEVYSGRPARIPKGLVFVSVKKLRQLPLATPVRKALAMMLNPVKIRSKSGAGPD